VSPNLQPATFQPVTTTRRILAAILVLSVLLRIAAAFYLGDTVPPKTDELSYHTLAARLATGHGYSFPTVWYPFTPADTPTSHWSFLYTAFVAAVYTVTGPHPLAVRLVQAVLAGILMPWLTYRLARRLQVVGSKVEGSTKLKVGGSKVESSKSSTNLQPATFQPATVPLIAAALSAVYAYFILYAAYVQTEAFFICAFFWSLERALTLLQVLRSAPAGVVPASSADGPSTGATQPSTLAKLRFAHLQPSTSLAAGHSSIGLTPGQLSTFNLQLTTSLAVSLGLATLLRQSILPWIAVMYLYILWETWKIREKNQRKSGPTFGWHVISVISVPLIVVLFVAPFTIRNYIAYGDFLLLNSNAGYAMYSAQHPMHGTSFQEYAAAPLPDDIDHASMNEATWDKELMRRGIGFVLADPGRYLLLSLSRVRDFVEFWPTADTSPLFNLGRVLSIGILLPFMLYGVFLAVRPHRQDSQHLQPATCNSSRIFNLQSSIFNLSFMVFYSLLHIFTWAMPRYRLPVDAVALPFAALALWTLAAHIRSRRLRPSSGS